jgi:hypothetical protein
MLCDGEDEMKRIWLTGATGMLTLVIAVVLMARSAPSQQPHGQQHGATTQSATNRSVPKP